jgi:hypothetical protein
VILGLVFVVVVVVIVTGGGGELDGKNRLKISSGVTSRKARYSLTTHNFMFSS